MAARMFRATASPSWKAAWALGGTGLPAASTVEAQSPMAHASSWPMTR